MTPKTNTSTAPKTNIRRDRYVDAITAANSLAAFLLETAGQRLHTLGDVDRGLDTDIIIASTALKFSRDLMSVYSPAPPSGKSEVTP